MRTFFNRMTRGLGKRGLSVLLSVLLLLSMMPIGVFTWAMDSNLIANGDFSDGMTGWKDFSPSVASGGTAAVVDGYAEIVATEGTDFALQTADEYAIEVTSGKSYTLTYRVKCAEGSLAPEILQYNAAGNTSSVPVAGLSSYIRRELSDWTEVSASFTAADDAVAVLVQFVATGTAQVDDVCLREATSSAVKLLNTYSITGGETNLIANGDMSVASGWSVYGATVGYEANGGHDGQALSLPYTHNGTATTYTLRMSNPKVSVTANTEYTLKAWIKTSVATRYYIQVVEYSTANTPTYHTLYTEGTTNFPVNYSTEWVEIALTFTTGADAAEVLPQIIFKDLSSTRDILVDDVSLVAKQPEPNMLGLIPNGDMALASGWMATAPGPAPVYEADGGHDGQALKLAVTYSGTNIQTCVRLTDSKVAVQPNTEYEFKAWMKTSTATRYSLQVIEYSSTNTPTFHTQYTPGTTTLPVNYSTEWVEITLTFTTGADAAEALPQVVFYDISSTRDLLLDDVSLAAKQPDPGPGPAPEPPQQPNMLGLIPNGDMELASGWMATMPGPAPVYVADGGHDGQALKLAVTYSGTNIQTCVRLTDSKVAVQPNTEYEFKAWMKTSTATRYSLQVIEYSSTNTPTFHTQYTPGTTTLPVNYSTEWVEITLTFTTGADAAEALPQVVFYDISSTRDILLDDVSLTVKLPEPNMLGLIPNGDMELASGWKTTEPNFPPEYVADGGHDGQALKVAYVHGGSNVHIGVRLSDEKVAVQPNTDYKFVAWIKTSVATRYYMQVVEYSSTNEPTYHTQYAQGTSFPVNYSSEWVKLVFTFKTGADAAEVLPQIFFRDLSSTRDLLLDDVSLEAYTPLDPGVLFQDTMEDDSAWKLNGSVDGVSFVSGGKDSDTALKVDSSIEAGALGALSPDPREFAVKPNTGYTLEAWVKTENTTAGQSNLFLQVVQRKTMTENTAANAYVQGVHHRDAPTEWRRITVRFITEADAAFVIPQIYFNKSAENSVLYVDNVRLYEDDTVVNLGPTDNFGFEYDDDGYPTNWSTNMSGGNGAVLKYGVSDDATEGNQSGYMSIVGGSIDATAQAVLHSTYFDVQPSTNYEFAFKAKLVGNERTTLTVYASNHKEDGSACSQASCWANTAYRLENSTDGWVEFRIPWVTPSDAAQWRLHFVFSGYDSILYLDDLRVNAFTPTTNFSFEETTNGMPSSWYFTVYGDTSFDQMKWDTEHYHSGNSSVYFNFAASEASTNPNYRAGAALLENPVLFEVEPDTYNDVSVWFKSRNAIGMPYLNMNLTLYNSVGEVVSTLLGRRMYLNAGTEISEWTKSTHTVYMPSNAVYACAWITVSPGEGEIWIDDIAVTPVQQNGAADKLVGIHDFSAVEETGKISGWTLKKIKGTPSIESKVNNEATYGELTIPSGAEGYAVTEIPTMLGGNKYEFDLVYRSTTAATAVIKYRDYKGDYLVDADVKVKLNSTNGSWKPFSFEIETPSHTMAELWIGSNKAGTICVEGVTITLHGSTASSTDWEGQWVWYPEVPRETGQAQSRFFREVFYLEDTPAEAPMQMTADDKCHVYVNGELAYSNMDAPVDTWSELKSFDLLPYLKKGENVIAFEVYNRTTDAGLLYDCRITMENGDMYKLLSGDQIKSNLIEEHGWLMPNFDDSNWKAVRVYGAPPIAPWGNIYFDNSYYVDCLMEVVEFDLPREVMAGTELTVDAVIRVKKQPSKDFDLKFNYIVRNNTTQVGSAYVEILEGGTPSTWKANKDIKLKLRFVVPDFVGEGRYNVMMDDNYVVVTNFDAVDNQFATIRVKGNPDAQKALDCKVEMYNGQPTIMIDGEPQSGLMTLSTTYDASFDAETYNKFYQDADISLGMNFSGSFGRSASTPLWLSDGSINFTELDNQILKPLSASPNSRLMVNLALDMPAWWMDAYPDEIHTFSDGTTREQSLGSEQWRKDMGDVLRRVIEHMMEQPYFGRIYGVRITAGQTSEWMSWKNYNENPGTSYIDYGPAGVKAFRNYLRRIYNNDVEALREAWKDSAVTFETAELATPEMMKQSALVGIFDAETQRRCIDTNAAMSEIITDSFLHFAKIIKDTSHDKLIVGSYNGYINHITGGGSNGQATIAIQRIYDSGYVDFMASCISYGERDFGMGAGVMNILEGAQAHGILIISENDYRTVLNTSAYNALSDANVGQSFTMQETIYKFRRDFSNVLTNGSAMWYYDMSGYYYRDDQMFGEFAAEKAEMDFSLYLDRSSNAEVALIYDEEAIVYLTHESGKNHPIINYLYKMQREQLATMGAPYDSYTLGDLVDGVVPDYKVYFMISPYQVTEEEAKAINKYLKNEDKTIVWLYMPAVTDGKTFDLERASEIVGIDLGVNLQTAMMQTRIESDVQHPLIAGVENSRFGNITGVAGPQMYVDDPEAIALGHLVDTNLTSLAFKEMDGWNSLYSAAGGLTNKFLRNILQYAGVHLYTDNLSDIVYSAPHYVALHSVSGGEKTLHLDDTYSVYDVYNRQIVSWKTDTITYEHDANETRLFRLMAPNKVYVTVDVVGNKGGKVSHEGLIELDKGSNLTVTVTPDAGYELASVKLNGAETALKDGKLAFTNLTEHQAIKVKFERIRAEEPEEEPEEIDPPTEAPETPTDDPVDTPEELPDDTPTDDLPTEEQPVEDPQDEGGKKQIVVYYDPTYTYNWPMIIALGVGGLLLLGGAIFLIIFLIKKKKKKEESEESEAKE